MASPFLETSPCPVPLSFSLDGVEVCYSESIRNEIPCAGLTLHYLRVQVLRAQDHGPPSQPQLEWRLPAWPGWTGSPEGARADAGSGFSFYCWTGLAA